VLARTLGPERRWIVRSHIMEENRTLGSEEACDPTSGGRIRRWALKRVDCEIPHQGGE